jgi:adenylate kinase family enzyme
MKRVLVIGSAGAGKSTLAQSLAGILDLPVIHLDALFWKPGWNQTPAEEWDSCLAELVKREEWIIDGNYGRTLDIRIQACDTIIFLDIPRLLCLGRVLKRSITWLGRIRPDLNEGCPERLPDREFLRWIWAYPKRSRPAVVEKLSKAAEAGRRVLIARSPRELARIVGQLREERGSGRIAGRRLASWRCHEL